jgi:metal-dependent hydrolase (beta-lactamase superfamily II)
MGEDLLDLDMVVLSHGHLDHTGGLPDLVRHLTRAIIEEIPVRIPTFIAHPCCFYPRPKQPVPNIGSNRSGRLTGETLFGGAISKSTVADRRPCFFGTNRTEI